MELKSFAEILKSLRKSKNLKQLELANNIGASQKSISNYEKNKSLPNSFILCCLADYFKVTTDYLLGRDDLNELSKEVQIPHYKSGAKIRTDEIYSHGSYGREYILPEEK